MTDLPQGWEWATLGEFADIQGGIQKQPKRAPRKNKYPFLRVANVLRGDLDLTDVHEIELFEGELDRYLVKLGDLLVVEGNGSVSQIGRSARWTGQVESCVHQNHLIRVRPLRGVDSEFLDYQWNSETVGEQLRSVAGSSSGLHTLSVGKLKRIRLSLPPLAEQRRIVEELDVHLNGLDRARSSLMLARARVPQAVASARAVLLSSSANVDMTLGDLLERIEAGRSFGGAARPAGPDEWGIVKVSAMTWGRFLENENKLAPDKEVNPAYEIHQGDILVSRANTEAYVGAPVLVESVRPRLLLSDKSLRLVPKPGVDRRWLLHVLAAPQTRRFVSRVATGTKDSMRNISQAMLRQIPIACPSESEQSRIADEIDGHLASLERLDRSLVKAIERGEALRRSLLADAFAGRLVPQDPADEPASVLLERVRAERALRPSPGRRRRAQGAQG